MSSLVGDRPLSIRRSPTSQLVSHNSGNRLIFSRSSENGYQGVRTNRTSTCTCRPPLPARAPRASLRTCAMHVKSCGGVFCSSKVPFILGKGRRGSSARDVLRAAKRDALRAKRSRQAHVS